MDADNSKSLSTPLLSLLDINIAKMDKQVAPSLATLQETFVTYLIETKKLDEIEITSTVPESVIKARKNMSVWQEAMKSEHYNGQSGSIAGVSPSPTAVWRRYTDFDVLQSYLCRLYRQIPVPPLPEKRATNPWKKISTDAFDPEHVHRRRIALEAFLHRVSAHPFMSWDPVFIDFMQKDSWRDRMVQDLGESWLQNILPRFSKCSDSRFESIQQYSASLNTCAANVIHARERVSQLTGQAFELHNNYGRVICEWSALDPTMGDALQTAGHFVDAYAACAEPLLEEEDMLAEELKEYHRVTLSLNAIVRHQQSLTQTEVRYKSQLQAKSTELENVDQVERGFILRKVFGKETFQQKKEKTDRLSDQIKELRMGMELAAVQLRKFNEQALAEVRQFNIQKEKDIREWLLTYALGQIRLAKKGVASWQKVKDAFQKVT